MVQPVTRLQSRTPRQRAASGQRIGFLQTRAIARALSLAIKVTSCVSAKRNRKLQGTIVRAGCGAQVGEHCTHEIRSGRLRDRVTVRYAATGIKPNTAIKQKAAIPMARVTSTSENPDVNRFFTVGKSSRLPLAPRTEQRQRLQELEQEQLLRASVQTRSLRQFAEN